MQTHLVSKIMHQNIAVILWQHNYSKNSFAVLVPDRQRETRETKKLSTGLLLADAPERE